MRGLVWNCSWKFVLIIKTVKKFDTKALENDFGKDLFEYLYELILIKTETVTNIRDSNGRKQI